MDGFFVNIPSEEHSKQIQLAAYKMGYKWQTGENKCPIYTHSDYLSFRNDKIIRRSALPVHDISQKNWIDAQTYFNFSFNIMGTNEQSENCMKDCTCSGFTLLHEGCKCQ